MTTVAHLSQTTLDSTPYTELNRLNEEVVRIEKRQQSDYVLGVLGSQCIRRTDWVMDQLDLYVRRDRWGVLPRQVVITDGKGVAHSVKQWAEMHRVDVRIVSVDPYLKRWPRSEFGKLGFAVRDKDLLDLTTAVVSFWERKQQTTPAILAHADRHGKLARNFYLKPREDT